MCVQSYQGLGTKNDTTLMRGVINSLNQVFPLCSGTQNDKRHTVVVGNDLYALNWFVLYSMSKSNIITLWHDLLFVLNWYCTVSSTSVLLTFKPL